MSKITRGEIWWADLDPTRGSEIRKTCPCLVLTADTVNRLRRTVVVVPYSLSAQAYPPVTVQVSCRQQPAVAVIDQVRALDKTRLHSVIERASAEDLARVAQPLRRF